MLKRSIVSGAVGICLLLAAVTVWAEDSPVMYIPGDKALPGWSFAEAPQVFEGENLFQYINGGAEIYLQHGFKAVAASAYKGSDGRYINLDIYEMTDASGAEAVYRHKAGEGGEALSMGDEAALFDYYLLLRQGRYFVTVTGDGSTDKDRENLTTLARLVVGKLPKP
jgi:hypothetical protein